MITFAGITPHAPLLIPNIGKEKITLVKKTKKMLERFEEDIYLTKPDIIAIISPHTGIFQDAFAVNAHAHFSSNFSEFGDMITHKEWKGADHLAAKISHEARIRNIPVRLLSEEKLDHGASVPLWYLTGHLPNIHVLPIGYSGRSNEDHLRFGALLKDVFLDSHKRIAIVASGDMAHQESGRKRKTIHAFDTTFQTLLEQNNFEDIINIPEHTISSAHECVYRSALILLGIIQHMHSAWNVYSYEAPLGVGYLVAHCNI